MKTLRRIKAGRPQRSAVKITARSAFNYAVAYGDSWEDFKTRHPLTGKLCENCYRRPARERHHLLPVSKGGSHLRSNVDLLCDECHDLKHPHLQRRKARKNARFKRFKG